MYHFFRGKKPEKFKGHFKIFAPAWEASGHIKMLVPAAAGMSFVSHRIFMIFLLTTD
jgi:hypothetical protein